MSDKNTKTDSWRLWKSVLHNNRLFSNSNNNLSFHELLVKFSARTRPMLARRSRAFVGEICEVLCTTDYYRLKFQIQARRVDINVSNQLFFLQKSIFPTKQWRTVFFLTLFWSSFNATKYFRPSLFQRSIGKRECRFYCRFYWQFLNIISSREASMRMKSEYLPRPHEYFSWV